MDEPIDTAVAAFVSRIAFRRSRVVVTDPA